MNIPEIAESAVLSDSLNSEAEMLEARLALIRSPEISTKLGEVAELRSRLKALLAELAGLEKGKLIPAYQGRNKGPLDSKSMETAPDKRPRRARISKEDANKLIVEALMGVPTHTMTRAELAEKTGLAKPKIDEGIKSASSRFEVTRGPGAVIKLLSSEA